MFLKGPGTLLGPPRLHSTPRRTSNSCTTNASSRWSSARPRAQCARADALRHVAGYCIANDYAMRDYLENWYRPNLRVKNRDGATVLGPWLVDAADVPDPSNLGLRTFVNGKLTQQGNTRDMIIDMPCADRVPELFHDPRSRATSFSPERPKGWSMSMPGDEVVCEIDGSDALCNTIVADVVFGR